MDTVAGDTQLRRKRELIEKFIHENLRHIEETDDIPDAFYAFWNKERQQAIEQMARKENLNPDKIQEIIGKYLFTEKKPPRFWKKPKLGGRSCAGRPSDKAVPGKRPEASSRL